jgi:hypothetical protein
MFRDFAIVAVTAVIVAGTFILLDDADEPEAPPITETAAAPEPAVEFPRSADGRPDFSGIWQTNSTANWDLQTHDARPMVAQSGIYEDVPVLAAPVVALGTAGWVPPGLGVVEGEEIPYQPWAAERKRDNHLNWLDRDPELGCYMPGVPRAMYMPYPFQVIHGTNKIMMVFEFANAQRTINLDEVAPYPGEAFMGYSVGRWEGDTLVVEVTDFSPYTWFDRAGNFHSDALRVVERYTPISPNAIQYEATIEDEKVFTRPWTIRVPLLRRLEPDAQILDFKCIEQAEETIYGHLRRETLVERWEGETMIIDVTRKVPPEDVLYELLWSGNPPEEQ